MRVKSQERERERERKKEGETETESESERHTETERERARERARERSWQVTYRLAGATNVAAVAEAAHHRGRVVAWHARAEGCRWLHVDATTSMGGKNTSKAAFFMRLVCFVVLLLKDGQARVCSVNAMNRTTELYTTQI